MFKRQRHAKNAILYDLEVEKNEGMMGSLSIDEAALMPNLRWHLQGTEGAGITCNLIWNLPLLLVCKRYLYS